MIRLPKLEKGDQVAILSPSFAAPAVFPEVYQLGLKRIREVFGLEPVEFPTTAKLGASGVERSADLTAAFQSNEIKGVIASLGGDDQVTYVKILLSEPFIKNPKPFFGFSDNTHFANFLWINGIPSFYGAAVMTQFAMQGNMDDYTVDYIKKAMFGEGEIELKPSENYNDVGLDWKDVSALHTKRTYEKSDGWFYHGENNAEGILWGGCVESIDELLRHRIEIPTTEQFKEVVLMLETSEEIPSANYVHRVLRALGELDILGNVKGVLVGRPKAWEFNKQNDADEKAAYREEQREMFIKTVRHYNPEAPIVQNMNFGHTDPQIPMPYGNMVRIDMANKKIFANFR